MLPSQQYYSRGVAHSDIRGATKTNPVRITRYEFVVRQFDAFLDAQGHYCEQFVAEFPETALHHART